MGKYAENTLVSTARTKADIEDIIQKYGAQQFVSGYQGSRAAVEFTVNSEPWNLCGTICVMLKGYRGGYALDGLTKVGGEDE